MQRRTLAWLGVTAVFLENYILPWTSLAIVYEIIAEMFKHREQTLLLLQKFFAGELPPSQTSLFLSLPFIIGLLTYNLTLALSLLVRKKAAHEFDNFREILLPLAACFYYYIFNLSVFLPSSMNVSLLPTSVQPFFMIFGVALMVVGFLVGAGGIFSLGNSFAIFVEARGLVTGGLYRFTRHPVYFGHLLRTIGLCLSACTGFFLIANAILIYLLVQRALLEEKKLLAHYPEYAAYTKKTPCFFLMFFGKDRHAVSNPSVIVPQKMPMKRMMAWTFFLFLSFAIGHWAVSHEKGKEGIAVSKDGVPIAYSVYGRGEPTLVFVHGWGGDRSFWESQVPYFKKRYRVVTLDLAGRGESGKNRSVYSMRSFGEDVAAVVQKLRASKVILVGHSSGGLVALEAAQMMPDRVTALIGVDSLQDLEKTYTPAQIHWQEAPFKTDYEKAMRAFVEGLCLSGTDPAFVDDITKRMLRTPQDVAVSSMDELLRTSYASHPLMVRFPIWCLNSELVRTRKANNLKYAPEFRTIVIQGAGHFLMMENPAGFNQLLHAVLKELAKRNTPKPAA